MGKNYKETLKDVYKRQGNCLAFTHIKLQSLAHSEAQRITETVVKNNYQHDKKTTCHDFGRVGRYNSGYEDVYKRQSRSFEITGAA